MFDFFNNILKLWQGSSKSQRSGLVVFFIFIVLGVGLYERLTAGFRLSKLECLRDGALVSLHKSIIVLSACRRERTDSLEKKRQIGCEPLLAAQHSVAIEPKSIFLTEN